MSPTSYQTAPPRNKLCAINLKDGAGTRNPLFSMADGCQAPEFDLGDALALHFENIEL